MISYIYEFLIGGRGYYCVEIIWRVCISKQGVYPHWTMFILGGLSLILICQIDNRLRCSIVLKAILSGAGITLMEFCLGSFYKFVLHSPIWTYGTADFMGIISFTWSLLWCGFSLLVIIIKHLINNTK
jgi:hypothetical protein